VGQSFGSCGRPWIAAQTSTWQASLRCCLAVVLKASASDLQLEELLAGTRCAKAHLELLALQDFLRSIPSKLLMTDLYGDWMAAMQRSSKEEKISELKA